MSTKTTRVVVWEVRQRYFGPRMSSSPNAAMWTNQIVSANHSCRVRCWARKRVLLRQELKVRRYGTIGPFWPTGMNKEDIWNEIKAQEKKISEGLQQPGAEEYAAELHVLVSHQKASEHAQWIADRRPQGQHRQGPS